MEGEERCLYSDWEGNRGRGVTWDIDYILCLDLCAGYMSVFALYKFIKLYTRCAYTFLYARYT